LKQATAMRTTVVTGAASGIGAATAAACAAAGGRVLGIDRAGAEIVADLSTPDGRVGAARAVSELSDGRIDAVIACAGVSSGDPANTVSINFFGSTALVAALRPLLEAGEDPRAVIISSEALLLGYDPATLQACLDGDEPAARAAASAAEPHLAYNTSKMAIARWVKREAVKAEWAASGVLLNAVAPGVVATPMIQQLLDTEEGRDMLGKATPMRVGRWAQPAELARLLAFLASPDNSFMVGQTVFCDGGAEATLRPEQV